MIRRFSASLTLAASLLGSSLSAQDNTELDERQSAIVPIAAHAASGDIARLRQELAEGLEAGLTVNEVKEVLIQTYAYAGFPRALNAINAFEAVLQERKARGINDPEGRSASPVRADFDPKVVGNHNRNTLVGADMSNRTSGYAAFTPTIDTFLVEHLFADIFQRDVLDWQQRELATISMLAALDGTDAQLKSHLGITHRQGLSWSQLTDFADTLRSEVGEQSARRTAKLVAELTGEAPQLDAPPRMSVERGQQVSRGPAEYFTGEVTVSSRFASDPAGAYSGALVSFQPGAHSAWHTHPRGQTLIVVSGRGFVQSEGGPVEEIEPGDVVWTPADTRHWHGATPQDAMSHFAISEPLNGSTVSWEQKLTAEEYPQHAQEIDQ